VKNSRHAVHNPYARYTKEYAPEDIDNSPVVSDPLRLLEICATSDGGAAIVVSSLEWAKAHGHENPVRVAGISLQTPTYPDTVLDLPYLASDSAAVVPAPEFTFKDSIARRAYAEAGIGPEDLSLAEVYDLSSALELDWYEHIGICGKGEAEKLLREGATSIGGRIPVNASGGLGAFGEAVPAQAIAQVCEMTWQLRGQAGGRQVEGAKVGLSINQGLFGHGSCVIVKR
jgi:acetyl-CoA acetyltransferase